MAVAVHPLSDPGLSRSSFLRPMWSSACGDSAFAQIKNVGGTVRRYVFVDFARRLERNLTGSVMHVRKLVTTPLVTKRLVLL